MVRDGKREGCTLSARQKRQIQKYSNYRRGQKKKLIEGSGGSANQNNVDGPSLWQRAKVRVDIDVAVQIDRNLWSSLRAPAWQRAKARVEVNVAVQIDRNLWIPQRAPAWHCPAWKRVQMNTKSTRFQRNIIKELAVRVQENTAAKATNTLNRVQMNTTEGQGASVQGNTAAKATNTLNRVQMNTTKE